MRLLARVELLFERGNEMDVERTLEEELERQGALDSRPDAVQGDAPRSTRTSAPWPTWSSDGEASTWTCSRGAIG